MTQELTVQQTEVGIFTSPEIVLENARTAARALADVLANKKKPVIMNGEQYLEFEDWQTCGQFYGYTVKTGEAVPVEVDGVKGAKAQADLIDIKTGMYLGGAEAYCMRDEDHWNTRPKYEWQGEGDKRKRVKVGDEVVPWFQLASMAQTRAGSKALRNRLAWVVVLAGYKATPAEEMTDSTVSESVKERITVNRTQHYCPVHDVNFFKKGKMKGYAHPIEGTDKWCNEDEEAAQDIKDLWEPKPDAPESKSTALEGEKQGNPQGEQEEQPEQAEVTVKPATADQKKRLAEALKTWDAKEAKDLLIERWQTNETKQLNSVQMEDFINKLEGDKPEPEDMPF